MPKRSRDADEKMKKVLASAGNLDNKLKELGKCEEVEKSCALVHESLKREVSPTLIK